MTPDEPESFLRTDSDPPEQSAAAELRDFMGVAPPDENPGAPAPPVTVQSPARLYLLHRLLGAGDIADVYLASGGGLDFAMKISRVDGATALLDNEWQVLSALRARAADSHYGRYFPAL